MAGSSMATVAVSDTVDGRGEKRNEDAEMDALTARAEVSVQSSIDKE